MSKNTLAPVNISGIKHIPTLSIYKVFDIDKSASEKFVERMKQELDIHFMIVDSAEQAFVDSDVVITATTEKDPYVDSAWYKPGVLHCEI